MSNTFSRSKLLALKLYACVKVSINRYVERLGADSLVGLLNSFISLNG